MPGHLLDEGTKGVFAIAATPFADNGALDPKSLERLIGFYIDAGVHGITILGMMGEAPKLTYDEARLVIRSTLRQVAGEVPVVVGVSSPGLATLAALTGDAMSLGAAAVMVAPPAGSATDEQLEGYVHQLAEAIGADVPLVLQDYPQATGVQLSVAVLNRLIDDLPQLKVLKHEDCPGLGKLTRIRANALRDGRRRIAILVGNGALYYLLELARGADGAMTGFAYPELLVEGLRTFHGRAHRRRLRPLRRLSPTHPLRAATRHRPCDPQGDPAPPRHHRKPSPPPPRRPPRRHRPRRTRPPPHPPRTPRRTRAVSPATGFRRASDPTLASFDKVPDTFL